MSKAQADPSPSTDPRDRFFDVAHLKGKVGKLSGRGGSFTVAVAGIKGVLLIGTTALLARLIPPEEFGVVALAMPALAIATNVSQLGLAHSVAERSHVTHRVASVLFWISLAIGAFAALVFVGLGLGAAHYFGDARVSAVYAALGVSVFFGAATTPFLAVFWRQMRIKEVETIYILAICISAGGAIIAALLGASYWAIVVQQILLPVANMSLLALRMGWVPSKPERPVWAEVRSFIAFGGHLAIFNLLFQISQTLGTFFVGRSFSQTDAALYYRSWNLARLPGNLILVPLGATFMPAFSRLKQDPEAFQALFQRSLSRIFLVLLPIGVAVCIAAPEIVRIMLGPTWLAAAPIFMVLGLRILWGPFSNGFRWALAASGKAWLLSRLGAVNLVVVAAALSFGQQFGIMGLALAAVLGEACVMVVGLGWLVVRHTPVTARSLGLLALEWVVVAAVLAGTGAAVLALLPETGAFLRLAAMGGAMLLVLAARLAVQADLRQDFKAMILRDKRQKTEAP